MDQEKLKQMVDRLQQVIDTLLAVDPNINLDEAILTALRNAAEVKAFLASEIK
jgi:hypothetical protein